MDADADTSKSPALAVDSPAREAAQHAILGPVLSGYVHSTRAEARCAGAVWLVSLVIFSGTHPTLQAALPQAQEALAGLLGDPNELTQETASRGLAAVYDVADAQTRAALVQSLTGALSGVPQKRRAVKVAADSQVLEPGTVQGLSSGGASAAGGASGASNSSGGLTTYKELCSLATDMGQPELLYRLMELANHQAAVNSARGAAFGFASVARVAGGALKPHMAKLIPRLYRLQYDPSPKVRDSVRHIWTAALDDPQAALTENFDDVAAALIADIGGAQWRAREAGALAAADLLQGRRWDALAPHFSKLWEMTFRVMDDVKETTRLAGVALARGMRNLTLRLADPEHTPAAQGREAVSAALPLLLEKGMPSRVPEVQALAADAVSRLVKAAGAEVVRPHLPALVPALLECLR
jgi:proteasome component ECM29